MKWRVTRNLILACGVVIFVAGTRALAGDKKIVGYYPDWNRGQYPPAVIPYERLTHIAQAFLVPTGNGSPGDTGAFIYPELIQAAHAHGVRVVASLGGWGGSGGFSPMAADSAARHRFVRNVLSLCVSHGYDGADIDWEYPATTADRNNLATLVHELRQAFATVNTPLSISLAAPAGDWSGQLFDFATMKADFDWVGMMTYDYYGSWMTTSGPNSPLYGHWSQNSQGWIDDTFKYYTGTRGVPSTQLLIGIPFYGWDFTSPALYGPSTAASQIAYQTIAPRLQQGWTRYWDTEGNVPYMINGAATHTVSYDDTESIRVKSEYAVSKGLGGAITWALGQDVLSGEQPLLGALAAGFGLTSVKDLPETGVPSAIALSQNYPNPFNPRTEIGFQVPGNSYVRLIVCDLLGRQVASLVDDRRPAGNYTVEFEGSGLASGTYFCRLLAGPIDGRSGAVVKSVKMLLLK